MANDIHSQDVTLLHQTAITTEKATRVLTQPHLNRTSFLLGRMENVHGVTVTFHPVALFTIVDSHERRKDTQKRVIGTLLGVKEKGVYEIRSAFCVPHNENEVEVAIDVVYEQEMYGLHRRVAPGEVMLGWFATSPTITEHAVLIHDYYSKRESVPVYITVDTKMKEGRMDIKAYISNKVGVPGKTEGVIFCPVPVEVTYFEPERVGVETLNRTIATQNETGVAEMIPDLVHIKNMLSSIEEVVDRLLQYVQDVIDGKIPSNSAVGRLLMETISMIPKLDSSQFEQMMNSAMQDLLMVMYLANLTKTQMILGEQLAYIPH